MKQITLFTKVIKIIFPFRFLVNSVLENTEVYCLKTNQMWQVIYAWGGCHGDRRHGPRGGGGGAGVGGLLTDPLMLGPMFLLTRIIAVTCVPTTEEYRLLLAKGTLQERIYKESKSGPIGWLWDQMFYNRPGPAPWLLLTALCFTSVLTTVTRSDLASQFTSWNIRTSCPTVLEVYLCNLDDNRIIKKINFTCSNPYACHSQLNVEWDDVNITAMSLISHNTTLSHCIFHWITKVYQILIAFPYNTYQLFLGHE